MLYLQHIIANIETPMDIKTAQIYLTLCETLHFGKTSEEHHVSPSTLSRQIQQLETQLGATLIDRNNRTISITSEGLAVRHYAQRILEERYTLEQELRQRDGELKGEISLYCSVTASHSFLHNLLSRFREQHPFVELRIHTGDPDQGLNRVTSQQEDIAIIAKPDQLPDEVTFFRITTTPLVIISPSDAPLDTPSMTPNLWSGIPLILPEKGLIRERVAKWFEKMKATPKVYAQVAGHEAIASMVSLGLGVGVIPQIVLENTPLKSSITTSTNRELGACDVGLCILSSRLNDPIFKHFLNLAGR